MREFISVLIECSVTMSLLNNKPIHYFNDENIFTYVDNSEYAIKNGISLEVIRNTNGQIENW